MTHVPLTLALHYARRDRNTDEDFYAWAVWCAYRPGILGAVMQVWGRKVNGEQELRPCVGEAAECEWGWEPLRRAA